MTNSVPTSAPVPSALLAVAIQAASTVITVPPTSLNPQLPPLSHFVGSVVSRSRVGANAVKVAIAYLDRMKSKLPKSARGLPCSCHRLFLASLILAAKYINDKTYKNRSWVSFTDGLFPSSEINLMERQFLDIVDFNVSFSDADFASVSATVDSCELRIKGILAQSTFAFAPTAFEPSTPPRESTLGKPCLALSHGFLPSPATPSPIPLSMLTCSSVSDAGPHRFTPYQVPQKMIPPSVASLSVASPY